MPAVSPSPIDATAAEFAAMDANVHPVGQRVCITDDGEKEYEARGAEGARSWVELHTGHVTDHETTYDHSGLANPVTRLVVASGISNPPETVWASDGTDWIYASS